MDTITHRFAAALSAVILVAGCASSMGGPDEARLPRTLSAEVGRDITLGPGDTARLPDGFALRFDRISHDSRCPVDVVCVTAGDATAELSLLRPSERTLELGLHGTFGTPTLIEVEGYRVEAVDLAPAPHSERPIEPARYRLTLLLTGGGAAG